MLASGSKVGPYEIVAPLGAGGMGEVYRARDSRLNREVAVKVLPGAFAADAERLRRFEQEARLAGALNHPNVLAVYDVGAIEGTPYIVSELLEGMTLRDRMRDGGLPLRRALNYATQIVHGLSAAHERGIVHRDLKPENVFVCRDERVKILDFGLAKEAVAAAAAHEAATMTSSGHTEPGVVLGTQGYMSPEQVRGQKVDGRSDIFAFGAILYEMVSGARAFTGTTSADVMTAILAKEPAEIGEEKKVPPTLTRIVHRCLEKEPERRFQSASDLGFALESVTAGTETGAARAVEVGKASGRGPWVVIGILVLGALFAAGFWRAVATRPATTPSEIRFTRLTEMAGLEEMPALSPDGKSVAFTADQGGERQIWVRLLSGGPPVQITRDKGEHLYPRWAHDASAILYYKLPVGNEDQGTIWEVPAMGGPPRRLASAISGADVSHDGERLAFFRVNEGKVELVATDRNGSGTRVIMSAPPGYEYLYPRWSPDDTQVAYQHADSVWGDDVYVVDAGGGSPRKVTSERILMTGLDWTPDGSAIVYASARGGTVLYLPTINLWEVPARGGASRQLTFGDDSYDDPDVSRTGIVVASRLRMRYDVWRIPLGGSPTENGKNAEKLTEQTGKPLAPDISPDEKELAFLSDSTGHGNIWIEDLASREMRQVTYESEPGVQIGLPLWNPNGKLIAYAKARPQLSGEDVTYWTVAPDGSDLREIVKEGAWGSWSADGKWLYYSRLTHADAEIRTTARVPQAGGDPQIVRKESGFAPAISPDGKTLYYVVPLVSINGSLEYEIRKAQPPDGDSTLLIRIQAGRVPSWQGMNPTLSHDGKWLALLLNDEYGTDIWLLSAADGSLKRATDFGKERTFIARRVSWSPDDRAIYASIGEGDADVVEVDGLIPSH